MYAFIVLPSDINEIIVVSIVDAIYVSADSWKQIGNRFHRWVFSVQQGLRTIL